MGSARAQVGEHLPEAYAELADLSGILDGVLDARTHLLVKLRASILNGCAFCLDMHSHEALAAGLDTRRLALVATWREAGDHFTEAERAVLELVDTVTAIGERGVPDHVYAAVAAHFSDREVVALITAIGLINLYNRLGIATGMTPPLR